MFNALNAIEYKRIRVGNYTFDKRQYMHDDLAYALALACLAATEYGVNGVRIIVQDYCVSITAYHGMTIVYKIMSLYDRQSLGYIRAVETIPEGINISRYAIIGKYIYISYHYLHMQPMFALTRQEIRVLEVLSSEPKTPTAVSKILRVSIPDLSRILRHLSQKGFITMEKHGRSKKLSLANTKHAIIFKRLRSEFAHIKLEQILTTSFLEVLCALAFNESLSRKWIVESSGISERTLHEVLKRLRSRGIATVDDAGLYTIDNRFSILLDFVLEFRHYANNSLALSFSQDAVILWERNKEFVIKSSVSEERDGFSLTAFSRFHDFGVTLFVPDYYHYYGSEKRKLSIEDVILHSVLMRPPGTRELTAILLLFKKNEKRINVDKLLEKAQRYGIVNKISEIVDYVKTQGRKKSLEFPEWDELAMKIREYEM